MKTKTKDSGRKVFNVYQNSFKDLFYFTHPSFYLFPFHSFTIIVYMFKFLYFAFHLVKYSVYRYAFYKKSNIICDSLFIYGILSSFSIYKTQVFCFQKHLIKHFHCHPPLSEEINSFAMGGDYNNIEC